MAEDKIDSIFLIPIAEKSLDQWVFDTIEPIIIVIDEIMKQLIYVLMEFDRYVH